MLGRDEQERVGSLDLGLEAGDGAGSRLSMSWLYMRQVVDLDEVCVEAVAAELDQRLRQLAVDGFAAVGADDDAELESLPWEPLSVSGT